MSAIGDCLLRAYVQMTNHIHLLLCQRYIELNPVRTAMMDAPAHYRWSSDHANGVGQAAPLLTPYELYADLGQPETKPRGRPRKPAAEQAAAHRQLAMKI